MREIGFDEIKSVELNILKTVATFCEQHQLQYFLAYGTLIGAVRHKGFIPWDDDIDIHMPRNDYDKLIKMFNSEVKDKNIKLISPQDPSACHSIVKIIDERTIKVEKGLDYGEAPLGIDIDVFPLDGEPESDIEYDSFYKKLNGLYGWHLFLSSSTKNATIKKKIAYPILKVLLGGKQGVLRRAARLHKKYPYETSKYVGAIESKFNFRGNRYLREDFSDFTELQFEDVLLRGPVGYDRILRSLYGDYMELPPPEKRVTHHSYIAYWKEKENEEV